VGTAWDEGGQMVFNSITPGGVTRLAMAGCVIAPVSAAGRGWVC